MTYDCWYCKKDFVVKDEQDIYKVQYHLEDHLRYHSKLVEKLLKLIEEMNKRTDDE